MVSPRIESYRFGHIVIDGQSYTKDLILLPASVLPGWWRERGHELIPEDLTAVLDAQPDVLVVGCGAFGRMRVLPQTEELLKAQGIELHALHTAEACDLYNARRGEARTAAALHLTC